MDNKEHWEKLGADYNLSWRAPAKEWLSRQELDFVSRQVPGGAATVLDVGIGNGRILEQLLRSTDSAQLYGVDIAEAMVDACRLRFSGEPRIVDLSVCDISAEPLPFDIPFDFISSIRVLKYSRNWPEIVARLVCHLSQAATADGSGDATLVFSMPNRRSLSRFSRAYAVPWETTTREELTALCARLGAAAVEVVGVGRLPFFVYRPRPRVLSSLAVAVEGVLNKMLGPTFLARELFVAVRNQGRHQVLRANPQRRVTADRERGVVDKTFLGGDPVARLHEAEVEFHRLQRLCDVVGAYPVAAAARPLELLPGPPPTVRMTAVPGRPLLEVLRWEALPRERLEEIAATAGRVLVAYVAASGEPYPDFQFDNLLFQEKTVGFVDLGVPDQGIADLPGVTALEVSLGHLVGSTMFQSARPKWLLRLRQRRQAAELCTAIVEYVNRTSPTSVRARNIRLVAHDAYRRCVLGGSWRKRIWYGTVGYARATRMRPLGAELGPPWLGPGAHRSSRSRMSVPGRANRK